MLPRFNRRIRLWLNSTFLADLYSVFGKPFYQQPLVGFQLDMVHKLGCPQLLNYLKQVDFIMQLGLTFLVKFIFDGPFMHARTAATTAKLL